ncbi:hypothetical protein F5544_22110 [Nocardia arthritidis]|uniref:Uncharacterized protein n=1 Tax=Nocardia arthritidis TaxID=228602 RepID=A0A6G9YGI1_9NOCA|nr:hypothetical protein F5544_22110 [Nocardia arthritidis]
MPTCSSCPCRPSPRCPATPSAAGAIAHDYRVMRADRGYFCFPEIDIHIRFTPGMAALIQAELTPRTAIASMTTGRRLGGTDAAAHDLVDAAVPADSLTPSAPKTPPPSAPSRTPSSPPPSPP